MKTKVLFLSLLAGIALASCETNAPVDDENGKEPGKETTPTLTVSGVTGNQIKVSDAADSTTFSVVSNVEWTITEDADWLSVNPASSAADTAATPVQVTVTVDENATVEERTATLTVSAEGVDNVVITVKQSGKEKKYLAVLNYTPNEAGENEPIESVNASFIGGVLNVLVDANTTWTVSSDCDWIVLDKEGGEADEEDYQDLAITINPNKSAEARDAVITFTGVNADDVTLSVSQVKGEFLSTEIVKINYCSVEVQVTPASEDITWLGCALTASPDEILEQGVSLEEAIVNVCANTLSANNIEVSIENMFKYFGYTGTDVYSLKGLDELSTYYIYVCGYSNKLAVTTFPEYVEINTPETPAPTQEYAAHLGGYTMYYNIMEENEQTGAYTEVYEDEEGYSIFSDDVIVVPDVINETYFVLCPYTFTTHYHGEGKEYFEAYLGEDGSLVLPAIHTTSSQYIWTLTYDDGGEWKGLIVPCLFNADKTGPDVETTDITFITTAVDGDGYQYPSPSPLFMGTCGLDMDTYEVDTELGFIDALQILAFEKNSDEASSVAPAAKKPAVSFNKRVSTSGLSRKAIEKIQK